MGNIRPLRRALSASLTILSAGSGA